jgi:hypothetical protein
MILDRMILALGELVLRKRTILEGRSEPPREAHGFRQKETYSFEKRAEKLRVTCLRAAHTVAEMVLSHCRHHEPALRSKVAPGLTRIVVRIDSVLVAQLLLRVVSVAAIVSCKGLHFFEAAPPRLLG